MCMGDWGLDGELFGFARCFAKKQKKCLEEPTGPALGSLTVGTGSRGSRHFFVDC